MYKKLLKKKEF